MVAVTRFGFLLPAGNTTVETEMPTPSSPVGTCHFQRFTRLVKTPDDLRETEQGIVAAAQVMRAARLSAIAVAYTAGSYYGGRELDERLIRAMSEVSGAPATTAAHAIVSGLRALDARSITVVSPYTRDVNERCERYLTDAGFRVIAVVGSPPTGPASEVPSDEVERMVRTAPTKDADVLLISCTALRTLGLIEHLERALSMPVVSSNSATLWDLMRIAGSTAPGPGRLFTTTATARSGE